MIDTWLLKPISLPPPPHDLLELAKTQDPPSVGDQGNVYAQPYLLDSWDNKSYLAPRIVRSSFDERFVSWVRENITQDFQMAGFMVCEGNPDTPSTGAHTDKTRDIALIYTVLPGGDANLTFWKEKGKPLTRDRGVRISSNEQLELIKSYPTPINQWYLLNVLVLHSVENLSSRRVNLQISFDRDLPLDLAGLII